MKYPPRPYQKTTTEHILKYPSSAIFLDMSLGKTVAALTAVAELIDRAEVRAVLVIAPLRVIQLTWPGELSKWDHLRGLTWSMCHGTPSQRRAALEKPADIYLINYENLIWLTEYLEKNKPRFDMVIYDESSKMKNHAAKRFKRLKPLLSRFHRNVILSGTPAPSGYENLWAPFFLLDRGMRLEPYFTHFHSMYFFPTRREGWDWALQAGAAERIEAKIAGITLSLRKEDHVDLPPVSVNRVLLPLPKPLQEQYTKLEKELFIKLDSFDVEAFNTAALSNKCLQFTSGSLYAPLVTDEHGKAIGKRTFTTIHSLKVDAIADIVDDASGSPVMVAYWFKPELAVLRKRFPSAEVLGSGQTYAQAQSLERRWNEGTVPVMLVHPASVGHGLNLQFGGHILVWASLPWGLEEYNQLIARLVRPGQKHPVIVHHLICPGTTDEAVELDKRTKDKVQGGLLAALRAYRAKK